jgi:hypothetical protein
MNGTSALSESLIEGLFGPELVLPEQFFERPRASFRHSGERALQWAVLADAVENYRRLVHARSRAGQREFWKVKAWVMQTDWQWPYSFVNLCTTFGFEPAAVRQALRRWEEHAIPDTPRRRFRHAA